jgi:hypothetical protein
MIAGWARRSGMLLAGGAGLTAGFAAGCAATLAAVRLTASFLAPAALVKIVAGCMGLVILPGVFVTVAAYLYLAAELRRIAARVDRITAPAAGSGTRDRDASSPASKTANLSSSARDQGSGQGQVPGAPPGSLAVPPPRKPTTATGMIGGDEPLQPTGESAVRGLDTWAEADERTALSPAVLGRSQPDALQSPGIGAQDGLQARMSTPVSERLVEVWSNYLDRGDGRFEPRGLQRQLEAAGLQGKVVDSLGEGVLGVDLGDGQVYILPHFNSTPQAVAAWFDARPGAASRLDRVKRLVQVAVARRSRSGLLEPGPKGLVE